MSDDSPRVRCPSCNKKYKVEPPMKFRCKECDSVVEVDEDGNAFLAKEKGEKKENREKKERKEGSDRPSSTRKEKTTERAKRVSEDGEDAPSSRRRTTSRRMRAESSQADDRTSRRGRPAKKSGLSPMVYAGIGGGVLVLIVIVALAAGGGGGKADAKGAPKTGLQATLQLSAKEVGFHERVRANWTITNYTPQEVQFAYTARLRHEIVEDQVTRTDAAGALPFDGPAPKEKSSAIGPVSGTLGGDEEVTIESLGIDESRYVRIQLAIWIEFEPAAGSGWTESLSTNKAEIVLRQPTSTEFDEYTAKFGSANGPEKKRILALVARNTAKGYDALFTQAMEDKAPSVSLSAAEYALARQVPGVEEAIRAWKNVKIKDPDQAARLAKLLERVGS